MKILKISILVSSPIYLWILQNYYFTKCLIWPLKYTCFANYELANREMAIIESFAKSVFPGGYTSNIKDLYQNFVWVPKWIVSHLPKIIETYLIYFLILSINVLFLIYKNKLSIKILLIPLRYLRNLNLLFFIKPYLIFSSLNILFVFSWFCFFPAYRFGLIYNLNFLIIFLLPVYIILGKLTPNEIMKNNKVIFLIASSYFLYVNIEKIFEHTERYGFIWPIA